MAIDHESLADFDSGAGANGEQGFSFSGGEAEGFLAQNVLAGFSGLDGPGDVEMMGKRIVDGVDSRIGDEFFIRAVSGGNAKRGCCLPSPGQIAGCDGHDAAVLAELHARDDFLETDIGGAEYSPVKLLLHARNDK